MAQIAVIIPSYNRAHLIERAITSVYNQSLKDFELIIVDDGSSDGTDLLMAKWDSRLNTKFFLTGHKGVSAARNFGVSKTSAPYICFLDSDDEWLPKKLEKQLAFQIESKAYISQTREIWIRNGVRVNPPRHSIKNSGDVFTASLERCMITPSSVMINRNIWEEFGGFDEDFAACEDYELWLRLTAKYVVHLLDEDLLIRYGGHEDQLSSKYPTMDKFRITALVKLLKQTALARIQEEKAKKVLFQKLIIYQEGCRKRSRNSEVIWCEEILNQFL